MRSCITWCIWYGCGFCNFLYAGKRAGAIFASMVTYGIPVVAIIWGVVYKEEIG